MNLLFESLFAADSIVATGQFSQFTAGDWVLIIGAISVAVSTILSNIKSSKNSERMLSAVVGTPDKQGLTGKLDQIHTATNSTLSESKADMKTAMGELKAAMGTIEELRTVIKDLKVEREKRDIVDAVAIVPQLSATIEQRLAELEKKKT